MIISIDAEKGTRWKLTLIPEKFLASRPEGHFLTFTMDFSQ